MRFLLILFTCVWVWKPRWHGKWVELREQFVGVSSFLLLCESWVWTQVIRLGGSTLSHWAISLAHGYILKRICQDVETQREHPPLQMNLPWSRRWPWWEQASWMPLRSGLLPWSCRTERMHRNIVLFVGFSQEHCPAVLQLFHVCARAGQTYKRRCWEPMFLLSEKNKNKTPCHLKEMWE